MRPSLSLTRTSAMAAASALWVANRTAAAKVLYDLVNSHMKYDKSGTGWGRGDAVWACENKHGNCTDFHSLFIALARANKIPAKFEIGFGLPPKHGSG